MDTELNNLNSLSVIMGAIYEITDTDESAQQKVDLILAGKLLIEKDGDLITAKLSQKEKYLKIFEVYLDLIMKQ